ncbi:MAG TPA: hypothetical protein VH813_03080 [Candidatus Limnocylindrales bacterium]
MNGRGLDGRAIVQRGALEGEDLLLGAWNLVAIPAGTLLAASWQSREPAPLLGLLEVLAVLLAVAALATRAVGTSEPWTEGRTWILCGPLVGALALVGESGAEHLGIPGTEIVLALALLIGLGAVVLAHRLPVIDAGWRRLLVLPLILVATGHFQDIVAPLFEGLDPAALLEGGGLGLPAGPEAASFGAFVLVLVLGGAAAFFAMLVVAPRELADPEPRPIVWVARFALFVASSIAGIAIWAVP